MSIEALAVSLHHSRAKGTTKLVLLGIANHEGDAGAFPSISTLCKYAGGVDRRTVQRSIQELIDLGEITCQVNGGGFGDSRPNLYRVTLRCPDLCDGSTNHRRKEGGGVDAAGGAAYVSPRGAAYVSPKPYKEPSVKPSLAQNKFERSISVLTKQEYKDGFNEFWANYPRKVGKGAAWKAYVKAVLKADANTIAEGARRLADDPNLPPAQFVPHPATWLNRDGWDDEPLPPREMTPEEKAEKDRLEVQRRREADRRHSEQLLRESREAREKAAPPPKCEHGNSIVSCRECFKKTVN